MQPYRDPDRPSRPEDVDPAFTARLRAQAGMIPALANSPLGCLIILAVLAVVGLFVLWGLQSLGIYQP